MRKKLTKSSTNVVLTGTLAGVAEFFGIDPTIVRVIYVILSFFTAGFPGIGLYIVLVLLIPSATSRKSYYRQYQQQNYHNHSNDSERPRKEVKKVEDDDWSDF